MKKVIYTDKYTEKDDTEGLKYIRWSMFDCPYLGLGSGKRYMERLPVLLLDDVYREEATTFNVVKAYCSKKYADDNAIPTKSPYRVGLAVELRVTNKIKRFRVVRALIVRGVQHIAVSRDTVAFDIDDVKNFKMSAKRNYKDDVEFVVY